MMRMSTLWETLSFVRFLQNKCHIMEVPSGLPIISSSIHEPHSVIIQVAHLKSGIFSTRELSENDAKM
jgi:hypothetical protein